MRKITPWYILTVILTRAQFISRFIPDRRYLEIIYRGYMGHRLDLENPRYFNEKIQWMKLYDRDPKYARLIDKYEVKKYVADTVGGEYVIPTLGVYDRFEDIDFEALPNSFVIKCTHDSGSTVVVKDKYRMEVREIRKKITKCLNRDNFYLYREWQYRGIKPRIIIEQYMENIASDTGNEKLVGQLLDYKIFTYGGEPRFIAVDFNRFSGAHGRNLYDSKWNLMTVSLGYPSEPDVEIRKPEGFGKMMEVARKLAKEFYFVRVDLYYAAGKIFFGELTFLPGSGFEAFSSDDYGLMIGNIMCLPDKIDHNK